MATTYKQVINKVLVRIGEEEINSAITTLTDTYHLLLGSIVNDIKEQIEDAHNWRALRQYINVTISANAVSGTITGANERSRIIRIQQANRGIIPIVFDITDSSNPEPLTEIDLSELLYRDAVDPDQRNNPCYFAVDNSSGDVLDLYVWPRPSAERTIKVGLIVPQDELSDLTTELKIPIRPLIVGSVWYALEERGEELGVNSTFSEERFRDALASAIARDSGESGDTYELVPT